MINNTLILYGFTEAIAGRHPTELAVLLENIQEEYKAAIELTKDQQEKDMLDIELGEITELLTEEINHGLVREARRCVDYRKDVDSEQDDVRNEELQERFFEALSKPRVIIPDIGLTINDDPVVDVPGKGFVSKEEAAELFVPSADDFLSQLEKTMVKLDRLQNEHYKDAYEKTKKTYNALRDKVFDKVQRP